MEIPLHIDESEQSDQSAIFNNINKDANPYITTSAEDLWRIKNAAFGGNDNHSISSINQSLLNLTASLSSHYDFNSTMAVNDSLPRDHVSDYTIYWVAKYMNLYYMWVIFAFGFPGNIVSFITILHMKPFTSPTVYVAALAFVDNCCLVFKLTFLLLTKHDVYLGDAGCGVLLFLGIFTAQFSNWLLVAMTVERCLAICLPLKVGSICTRKMHIASILVIILTLVLINSQNFFTNRMENDNGDYRCVSNPEYVEFMRIWFWVDGVFYAILPSLLLVIMNTLVILGIRRSAKVQRELTSKANQVAETMRQQRQITIMLVIVCIAFVVLVTPNAIFYAVMPNWHYKKNTLEHATFLFTQQLFFVLCDSTHAINFYLYFFSTRRFRKRCLETVFFCCVWNRRSRSLRGSGISGMTNAFRLSMTEVSNVPSTNAVPLRQFSSSSSSSSASSLGKGRHIFIKNGGENARNSKKKDKSKKDKKKVKENGMTRYKPVE